jgi:transcriptional regulator with PAS, ATPase and Fis domain
MNTVYKSASPPDETDDLLKVLIEDVSSPVFVIDPQTLRFIKVNQNARNLLGFSDGEIADAPVQDVFSSHPHARSILSNKSNGGRTQRTMIIDRSGKTLTVDIASHVVQYDGQRAVLVIGRNPESSSKPETSEVETRSGRAEAEENLIETNLEFPSIVGQSDQIRRVCSLIGLVSKTDSTVLIQGESGTGKELIAQAVHFHSLRARGPLVKVNCAALTETLLESELFGHKKGSFTGAIQDRKGRFKLADGGTIILDEIGSMSLSGQAKLLRVLQEKEFEPVGESQTVKVNVRIIAITNADLINAIHEGKFREDLFYRLNAFPIYLPPLRERKVDIPLLVRHFLKECKISLKKEIEELDLRAIQSLMDYCWPGNVRELKNAVEYAVIMEKEQVLNLSSLPDKLRQENSQHSSLKARVESAERQIILEALSGAYGIKSRAAKLLGIDRRNLSYFLNKHDIR